MKKEDGITIRIPKELFAATTRCDHAFSCLVTGYCGSRPACLVLAPGEDGELLLRTREDFTCPYVGRRSAQRICTCPIYHAMHRFIRP